MFNTLTIFLGSIIILYGCVLLTGKRFMINRLYEGFFTFFIVMLKPTLDLYEMRYEFIKAVKKDSGLYLLPILLLALIILIIQRTRHRYIIANANSKMISATITDILKEKNISYEEAIDNVTLLDYDNKRISYKQSMNSVDVDLDDIQTINFYKELKEELRGRIKGIDLKIFPKAGFFYMTTGIVYIILMQYLYSR